MTRRLLQHEQRILLSILTYNRLGISVHFRIPIRLKARLARIFHAALPLRIEQVCQHKTVHGHVIRIVLPKFTVQNSIGGIIHVGIPFPPQIRIVINGRTRLGKLMTALGLGTKQHGFL